MQVNHQPIYDIAPLCYLKGVRHVVLCPGSRCAPLTLAFTRYGKFNVRVLSDERSAAFVALGIAQQTQVPVVLICTSGSAVYNFSPAVAEAFFAEIPLLVLSADRPTEWIAQHDGQTIFQENIFGKHVKASYQLPESFHHADAVWMANRQVNEALNLLVQQKRGPVHINIPLREPLYPATGESISFSDSIKVIERNTSELVLAEDVVKQFARHWQAYTKVLIVCGQHEPDVALTQLLRFNAEKHAIPVIADILSNQHTVEDAIKHADAFLTNAPDTLKESLQPEVLITFGKSVISKQTKLFLRKHKPLVHWHIQEAGEVADTYQTLTNIAPVSPTTFFTYLSSVDKKEKFEHQKKENYAKLWRLEENASGQAVANFFPSPLLGEFEIVKEVLANLPVNSHLHLANSMSVRYANFIGLSAMQSVSVHANRGTSGIDGCTSTVVGHCLANPHTLQVLITGDIAFFYDRNAFWHNYPLPNLRIVLLNNHGGVIFSLIDGPAALPEAGEYFVTRQRLTAKHLCAEAGIEHLVLDNRKKIKNHLMSFFETGNAPKILEIESDVTTNKAIFESFKQKLKERYES
jgi:2-succinyl-5-enolpyruvyl-6-hydroxy-3-cyclohexene-1-carboxylate synthase